MKVTFPSSFTGAGKRPLELVGGAVLGDAVLGILEDVVDDTAGAKVVVDDVGGIDVVASSTTNSSSQLSSIGTTPGFWLSTTTVALA